MAAYSKMDLTKMDEIIKKTIHAINLSKSEIYDIAENARMESRKLEGELKLLKLHVNELIDNVEIIEADLKESKQRLMLVNKNPQRYSQEELKNAYEKADNLRVQLAVKREQEQNLIKRRNDLELRIKESFKTVQKADRLISNLGVALGYMTGDLQQLSVQLEDLQQKQMLGVRIIEAQEEERQRVARDIHDGPAQSMSNVVIKAELCERLIDVDTERVKLELQKLKAVVRECLNDVRKIIYNLRPMSLDDLGLIPTTQRYILTFKEETGIDVSFKTRGVYAETKSVISLAVFRIVQEAINNIKKHSMAENAVVNMEFQDDNLKLYIYDDGKGFDSSEIKSKTENTNSGFGLISMKERVELLNGKFEITSQPGKGTRINIWIPLVEEGREFNE